MEVVSTVTTEKREVLHHPILSEVFSIIPTELQCGLLLAGDELVRLSVFTAGLTPCCRTHVVTSASARTVDNGRSHHFNADARSWCDREMTHAPLKCEHVVGNATSTIESTANRIRTPLTGARSFDLG